MLRLVVERLMNMRCCCEQGGAAYRTVLYPNHYSEAPGRQPTTDVMQVCIAEALRGRVMGLEHYPTSKSHPGVQRMYAAMKRCFY